ncbi:terminase small subunit [Zavarzinella formosa]|uniref:terminase small subunit n=1 Tax=Zavarzinella formosa TaxID=360055 RepID=UPI0003145CCF|nr:terminase small subunit [Zavarzinella formosa]
MTDKLTPKQEAFCLKYIELGNASEAYRQSYDAKKATDKTIWEAASRLLADSKVGARVKELRERAIKKHDVTVASLLEELQEARQLARDLSQPNTMVSATMGKAKLAGLANDAAVNVNVTNHLPERDKALLDEYAGKAE